MWKKIYTKSRDIQKQQKLKITVCYVSLSASLQNIPPSSVCTPPWRSQLTPFSSRWPLKLFFLTTAALCRKGITYKATKNSEFKSNEPRANEQSTTFESKKQKTIKVQIWDKDTSSDGYNDKLKGKPTKTSKKQAMKERRHTKENLRNGSRLRWTKPKANKDSK